MAKECYYELKFSGKHDDIDKLIDIIKGQTLTPTSHMGGEVGSLFTEQPVITDHYQLGDSEFDTLKVVGSCDYSVMDSGIDVRYGLKDISKELGLLVEAYGENKDCGFQEHEIINEDPILNRKRHWICVMPNELKSQVLESMIKEELKNLPEGQQNKNDIEKRCAEKANGMDMTQLANCLVAHSDYPTDSIRFLDEHIEIGGFTDSVFLKDEDILSMMEKSEKQRETCWKPKQESKKTKDNIER